jgi:hypothetical protein
MKSLYPLLISSILIGCSNTNDSNKEETKAATNPAPTSQPTNVDTKVASSINSKIDIEDVDLPLSTKAQLSVAVVEADQKWHIWMEGRSGIIHANLNDTYWLEQGGVALTQGSGQYNHEIDGHTYLTPKKLSTVSMSEKMKSATENKTGIKIILEMTDKGKYITQVKPPTGRSARLATTNQKPVSSAIFTVANKTDALGKPKPKLSANLAKEAKISGLPSAAKKLEQKNPKIELQKKWEADMKELYEKAAVISYSTMINLDNDEADEGFFCAKVKTGMTCFVYDTIQGNDRYYFTGFNWKAKEPIYLFSTDSGIYISHQQKLSKASVTKVLRFDGSGYTTEKL